MEGFQTIIIFSESSRVVCNPVPEATRQPGSLFQAIQADLGRLELQGAGKVNEDKLTGF